MAGINPFLCRARGDIAWAKVTKSRITAFKVIVSFQFRNFVSCPLLVLILWYPDPSIVSQRFGHQSQLGLVFAGLRKARWMDLSPTRIGKKGSAFMGAPNSRRVTTHRQRPQIIDLAESASAQHDRVGGVAFHRAGIQ